ncbi:copper amine oxidase N-terminal domain-containing protein [Paenibacillus sp. sgz500958]|uniref:copper amine oxidase N-terminal domain-containing protein n=1 Tax=Paenibacillus sp. sgz500958 TaxID=3242475 RepID=UPI0036D3704A
MKKGIMILTSCILAVSLVSGSAWAKSEKSNGADKKPVTTTAKPITATSKPNEKEVKEKVTVISATYNPKDKNEKPKVTVTTATYAVYGNGHNGYKGLLHAIENVKDKPAGAVIADLLLTKYNTQLTPEMKAKLEAIKDRSAALNALADLLHERGSVTDAVYVEKEAILANVKNINSYKKLGELYDKLGVEGVKLFVNGEEITSTVAPVQTSTSVLVPFKVVSEALDADVVWNQKERSVALTKDGVTVKLFINKKTAFVNGKAVTLQAAPTVVNGSTLVPVRFVSQSLNTTVQWEPESQTVVVYEE